VQIRYGRISQLVPSDYNGQEIAGGSHSKNDRCYRPHAHFKKRDAHKEDKGQEI
jgi:hypothetical protein